MAGSAPMDLFAPDVHWLALFAKTYTMRIIDKK
jgi:hypothetical protein